MSPLLFLGLARKAQDALAQNQTWVLASSLHRLQKHYWI